EQLPAGGHQLRSGLEHLRLDGGQFADRGLREAKLDLGVAAQGAAAAAWRVEQDQRRRAAYPGDDLFYGSLDQVGDDVLDMASRALLGCAGLPSSLSLVGETQPPEVGLRRPCTTGGTLDGDYPRVQRRCQHRSLHAVPRGQVEDGSGWINPTPGDPQ